MESKTFVLEEHYFNHDKDIHYCAYCGEKVVKNSSWDHYEEYVWYSCSCPMAVKEYELNQKIKQLKKDIIKCEDELKNLPIEQKVKDIKFEYENNKLKKFYNQK